MGETTGISWCDHTFNTWWGCVKVSEACRICYALTWAERMGFDVWGPTARRRFFGDAHWNEPVRWNRAAEKSGVRRRVFCSSMADVFEQLPHEHPDAEQMEQARARLMKLIAATSWLDWLLLTKRPDAMREYFDRFPAPANVIAMTTVENQQRADERLPHLLATDVRRRGVSIEPMLGPIRLDQCAPYTLDGDESNPGIVNAFSGMSYHPLTMMTAPTTAGDPAVGICWVIAGGESGTDARPTHPDWIRSLRDQCTAAGVPFHFKQWGEYAPAIIGDDIDVKKLDPLGLTPDGRRVDWMDCSDGVEAMARFGKKAAGRLLDGREWLEFPREVSA